MAVPPDTDIMTPEDGQDGPDVMLWAALVVAPPEGTTVPDLMTATGMSRPWIYLRLRDLADEGHVIQVSRGRWRAVTDDTE
jgi:S-DNA-T family DNA segregation ATPase FtsK/SpoIIIE